MQNSDFIQALDLCVKILEYEPENETMQAYAKTLNETIEQSLYLSMLLCSNYFLKYSLFFTQIE